MSEPRKLRCYQYVDRPYTQVRALLRGQPLELLERATTSAAARAKSVAANLKVELGGIEIGVNVRPHVVGIRDDEGVAGLSPVTRMQLGWEAARAPALFPLMRRRRSSRAASASSCGFPLVSRQVPRGSTSCCRGVQGEENGRGRAAHRGRRRVILT
jgi:hypothetical protein